MSRGELPAYKPIRKALFRKEDLDAWVQRHRVGSLDDPKAGGLGAANA
jgi:hypothetical protein